MQLIFILIRSFAWVETLPVVQPEASENSFKLKPGDCCCSAAEIKKLKSMPIRRTNNTALNMPFIQMNCTQASNSWRMLHQKYWQSTPIWMEKKITPVHFINKASCAT